MQKQVLSIIIPCYNESQGIPQLVSKLRELETKIRRDYKLEKIFVDDGSTDKTYESLHAYFGKGKNVKIIQHKTNMNLGGALKTGFANASGSLIAVLDSDCTYNPNLLIPMLKIFDKKTDIVTVSPYHPNGKIKNVPLYRIFLSRNVSRIYRFLLGSKIHTYTAMVRIYKKNVIKNIKFESNTFLGITEIMIKALLEGYKVKEFPAELSARKFGISKIKTLSVMFDHFKLINKLLLYKTLKTKI